MGFTYKGGGKPTIGWQERRRVRSAGERAAGVAAGAATVAAGVLIAPLPGPLGLPVAAVGAGLILRNSPRARRWFVSAEKKHPKVLTPVRRVLQEPRAEAERAWSAAAEGLKRFRKSDPV